MQRRATRCNTVQQAVVGLSPGDGQREALGAGMEGGWEVGAQGHWGSFC